MEDFIQSSINRWIESKMSLLTKIWPSFQELYDIHFGTVYYFYLVSERFSYCIIAYLRSGALVDDHTLASLQQAAKASIIDFWYFDIFLTCSSIDHPLEPGGAIRGRIRYDEEWIFEPSHSTNPPSQSHYTTKARKTKNQKHVVVERRGRPRQRIVEKEGELRSFSATIVMWCSSSLFELKTSSIFIISFQFLSPFVL